MDLYLIRHGQSINNREDTHVDFPRLTDLGYEQAHLAGKALKDINLVKLYCSPMLRSVQTAQKVGSMINLDPQIIVELHEGGGVYTLAPGKKMGGLKRSKILESSPNAILPKTVTEKGWRLHQAHTKEEGVRLIQRNMEKVINFMMENHYDEKDKVAVITHGRSGSILISTVLGMPPDRDYARFGQNNCGISLIRMSSDVTRLVFLNRIDHMPVEYVT